MDIIPIETTIPNEVVITNLYESFQQVREQEIKQTKDFIFARIRKFMAIPGRFSKFDLEQCLDEIDGDI